MRVLQPSNANVANYMARMHLGKGLPGGTFELPVSRERDRSEVLIPVTRLHTDQDVDRFNEEVAPVIRAHADDVAVLEEAISMAIAELCGNGVEHGANPLGCYAAVQRYPTRRRTVLAIGDLGCGIPASIRSCFREIDDDPAALEYALQEGVTTTGRASRGQGFYWVMDAAQQSHIRFANLDVRAGRGRVTRTLASGGSATTTTAPAPNKRGDVGSIIELYGRSLECERLDMRFKLTDHAEVFSTRSRGAELRALLEKQAGSASVVEIDFGGVKGVSYSFADEFVGELAERAAQPDAKLEIALADVPQGAERVILGSLERRGLDRAVLAYA